MRPNYHHLHMNRRPISVTICGKPSKERSVVIRTMIGQRADGSRIANPHIAESVKFLGSRDKSCQLTTLLMCSGG
jgi:hypothetical protein